MDTTIPFKYSLVYILKHKYIWKFPNFETHKKIKNPTHKLMTSAFESQARVLLLFIEHEFFF